MEVKVLSDVGLMRTSNEDAYLARPEIGLFAVADGLGGHLAGEVASWLAVKTIEEALSTPGSGQPQDMLHEAMLLANARIIGQSRLMAGQRGMGTTLTVAWLQDSSLYLGHVGDSSAYHYRQGCLNKLTQDHSLVEEMRRLGGISEKEARSHPQRHILTRALGVEPDVLVDIQVLNVKCGDVLMLCTDGLTSQVTFPEMEEILRRSTDFDGAADALLQLALRRGAPDNVTLVLVRYA